MKRIKILSLIISVTFLTSCVQTQIIEDLAIITARGIDVLEDDQIEKTVNVIRFDANQENLYATISGVSKTLKGAQEVLANQIGYQLTEGQLNLVLYGKEAAKQGITRFFMSAVRDSRTSDTMHLAVADRTAKEIFNAESEEVKNIGQFLEYLLEKNIERGSIPSSNLQDFSRTAGRIGQDGVLPLIGLKNEIPSLIGLAIIKDDKHVLNVTLDESMLISLFTQNLNELNTEMTLPIEPFREYIGKKNFLYQESNTKEKETITAHYLIVNGKSKTKLKNMEELSFQTDIELEIDLLEITQPIVIDKKEISETFKKEIEKAYEKQLEDLLIKLQEVATDPFGYGTLYRLHTKDGKLDNEEWREKFPNITVDFNVDVNLMHTGTIQ